MIQQRLIVPRNNNSKSNNSYKYNYSFASVLFVPTISSESLNINLMRFIEFLNDNSLIIFSSSLGLILLGLFILYMNRRNIINTNLSSDNNLSLGSSNNNPNIPSSGSSNNNNSNITPRTNLREIINYIFGYSGGTAAFIALGQSYRVLPTWFGFNNALFVVTFMGALGYHMNTDREAELVNVNHERSISPPLEDNFNPGGRNVRVDVSSITKDLNNEPKINSSNEDDNFFNFFYKFLDFIKEEEESLKDHLMDLIAYDEDPTMLYLVCLCVILCNILINLVILLFTFLVKNLKLEEKEFVKNTPLLYKIVLYYNKIKNIKIIIIVIMTIIMVGSCFILCYFMWDSFWYYK